jgi:Fe-S cluster assembly protein SufD
MTLYTREAVEEISRSLNEPEWMREFRRHSLEIYNSMPMPTMEDEPWRRTDIHRLKLDSIGPSHNGYSSAIHAPEYLGEPLSAGNSGGVLVQENGITRKFEVDPELANKGVIFCGMDEAVRDHPELVKKYFMTKGVSIYDGKFAALHGAFWRGGTFLYVPIGVEVEAPFHSAFWTSAGKSYSHTLVVLEQGAKATLVDEYGSEPSREQALHNGAVELLVGEGSHLVYAALQDFSTNVWQFNHERGRVGRDGHLDWVSSVMGTRLVKNFQTVELDGRGSSARMSGLFFGDKRQHFDLDTQQNHNAPDTTSDLLYKGALKDKARSVWQGIIKALPDSQRIDGFQANRNLLLSKTARADSIPGLEIEADDVRCTHASTIGNIDQEQIFYLMTRGITTKAAEQMVVEGFFAPVLERIPVEGIRERLAARIIDKVG